MDRTPLVSVVIPVYDKEPLLPETLDSILASTYPNLEVLVVDCSMDEGMCDITCRYECREARVHVFHESGKSPGWVRNYGIRRGSGTFVLPFSACDRMVPSFIADAVQMMLSDSEIKVVCPQVKFFGECGCRWVQPPFSLKLLAKANVIPDCSLFRKSDWERAGGYNEAVPIKEDWLFWIALLKDGGKVAVLPSLSVVHRIAAGDMCCSNEQERMVTDVLNACYPEFFERELGGPVHYRYQWSVLLNIVYRIFHPRTICVDKDFCALFDWVKALPALFKYDKGQVIYKGRNELREMEWCGIKVVVKSFRVPNLINRIAYGIFRSSKAQRSFEYADMLLKAGIGTPLPVAYYTERNGLLFTRSYYVSLKSECPYSYIDLMKGDFPGQEKVLRAIARTTASLHDKGYLHKDYSRGNILFRYTEKGVEVEIIDLNRIRFRKVDIEDGCRNFERLPGTPEMFAILADEYAKARGFDAKECLRLILKYNNARI